MKVWAFLLLTAVSVWGFPEKRTAEKQSALAQLGQQVQQNKENRVRETQRDCNKGKCATSIAQKAAAEAKAAQAAQNAAGAQAAHMVKTQLAEKALQAAKAAEAALAGKQAVVEQLQQEVKEAEAVVAEDTAAVHQQQGTVNAAIQAAQQATAQHKLMMQATQLASQLEKTALCVLEKTKIGLQEKCHNLAEARARLAHLQHKLQCACADCAATKQAAHCACEAARAACGNARKRKDVNTPNAMTLLESKIRR
ncbi:tol-Pal system protein TolA-like isoform X2 [Pectinophora gossypiella]|uniref:tol-Pal system protein TolA-like isoform X2 n=1 Tax=Pectinophora gossypiella TaxID=13191 RepID=UPI00214E8743|nr:tol-Pal system protein TolA-like isoform X2 [Pectinophora gossypiella]